MHWVLLQISAFFLFSNFRKGRLLYIHLVGRLVCQLYDHPDDPVSPCSSIPLQMVICKEDSSPDDQNQEDRGAWIVPNDHLDDPAYSVPLQMVVCKEDCPSDDQNQRDGGARIIANDHLDDDLDELEQSDQGTLPVRWKFPE